MNLKINFEYKVNIEEISIKMQNDRYTNLYIKFDNDILWLSESGKCGASSMIFYDKDSYEMDLDSVHGLLTDEVHKFIIKLLNGTATDEQLLSLPLNFHMAPYGADLNDIQDEEFKKQLLKELRVKLIDYQI